jgi:PIN domain nuclease of toxin-antitoxin system
VRLLLDTHSFLWFIGGDRQLSKKARDLISDVDNEVLLSLASIWEIAIKVSVGGMTLIKPLEEFFTEQLAENDIDVLPIALDEVFLVATLPLHHRDPFDRLIIAQGMVGDLAVVTKDPAFSHYSVKTIW